MWRAAAGFWTMAAASGALAQTQTQAPMAMTGHDAPCPAAPTIAPAATLTAASDAAGLDRATIAPGRVVALALADAGAVIYPLAPAKPPAAGSHGGLAALTIAMAGTYRIAVSSGAWIDLVRDGAAVASSAHRPAPPCSGLHKQVEFPLAAGRYTLQLSGSATPRVLVKVTVLP